MTSEELKRRLEDIERQIADVRLVIGNPEPGKDAREDVLQDTAFPGFWRLSRRLMNVLARQGIHRVSDIASRTQAQMENTPGIGEAGMRELKQLMRERGLTFSERPIA